LSTAKKRKHYIEPKPEDFEEAEKAEADETETEDIYNTKERERMLEEDEITAAEEGFMLGRDQVPNKRISRRKSHDDDISVELSQKEAEED
jgi:hypothetical protein